jgi:hypothetical protein
MKAKIFSSLGFAVLFLLVLTGFTSGAIILGTVPTLNQTGSSFNINITSDVTTFLNLSSTTISDSEGNTIVFTSQSGLDFTTTLSQIITVGYVVSPNFDFEFGEEYSTVFTVVNSSDSTINKSETLSFEINEDFCSYDDNEFDVKDDQYLDIKKIEISNKGFGDEDNWYPLDEIEVTVTVEAGKSDVDVDNVDLEWGLYDKTSKKWAIKVEKEDDFDLDGDDKKEITFTFNLDDSMDMDLDELEYGDLELYVRVTGKADSKESIDGDVLCWADSLDKDDFEFVMDEFVLLNDIQIIGGTSCGDDIQIIAEVWNIDDGKQKEVSVMIYNKELGINKKIEIGDIKAFDSTDFDTMITLSEGVSEKQYILTFSVYDDDNDLYEIGEDDEKSVFFAPITINSCYVTPTASVSASLQSEAKAGKDFVVKTTIVNTGSETKTFTVSASNYADWASATLDKTSVTLSAGQSTDVLITFSVNKGVSGEQGFDIEVLDGKMNYLSQPISVDVKSGFSLPSLTGLVSGFQDNFYFYGIIALNVILVLVIVIVAVKIAKKKKQRV